MKNTTSNPLFFIRNFFKKNNLKKANTPKISVHRRRDLDALGEYIKI